ncbi:TRAP transporter small permease [Xanthobacter sp. KR7-225]|uniref:TRAP transporter small permease n=1 Tax=Xanthobacter sp. KR7-225 TaxID=3156613 RepID=UPI0032B3D8A0
MAMLNLLDRAIGWISLAAALLAIGGLACVFVSVTWEVISRDLLGHATIWSNEFSIYGVIAIAFLGAGHVLRLNGHLEVDLITARLSKRVRDGLGAATDLVAAVFCALVVHSGVSFVELSNILGAVSVGELRIPLWIPQSIIPVSFLVLTLEFLARALVRLGLVRREAATFSSDPVLPV